MKFNTSNSSSFLAVQLVAVLALSLSAQAEDKADGNVIKVVAKKFTFTPKEITVKKGEPVTLEFTTSDRSHGFKLPDMHVRTTIEPGKVSTVKFTPTKTGSFDFYCDVFCGKGHPDMGGTLKVTN